MHINNLAVYARSSAVTDMLPDACCISYYVMKMNFILLHQRAAVMHVVFQTLRTYAISTGALNEGIPQAIGFTFGAGKLEWLGYNTV